MHKFIALLCAVLGGFMFMSNVALADDPAAADTGTETVIERNVLPLGNSGYDNILTNNRASQIIKPGQQTTGEAVKALFVNPNGGPSTLVTSAYIIIAVVALLYLAVTAVQFIISRGEEEGLNKAKKNFGFIILGLLVIGAALTVSFSIFDPETKNFLTGEKVSNEFLQLIQNVKVFIQIIIGAFATLSLVISGYELITRQGSDEVVNKEKEFIKHFMLAAGLIALTEVLVRGVFYARNGANFDSGAAVSIGLAEIVGVINFLLGFVAVAATFMLVLASLYYVISLGDEDRTNRAKRIIFSSVGGTVIAISAYTIIAYFVRL